MNCSPSNGFTWLVAFVLAFAVGCGGSDETDPAADDGNSSATSPEMADNRPTPGEPQGALESDAFPRVEFQTSAGNFTVKLHRDLVPITVDNFLDYVEGKFYVGTILHEVTPDYAIVGGNYTMDGGNMLLKEGGAGIYNEAARGLSNKRGTIAMAREPQDADSASCQFFINLGDNSSLDYVPNEAGVDVWQTAGYCAFGEVEGDGLKVLDDIANRKVTSRNGMDRVPNEPIVIISARQL